MALSGNTVSINQSSPATTGKCLKWLSVFTFLILPLTVLGYRLGLYQFSVALILLALSLFASAIIFLMSLFISLKQRSSNQANSQQARLAMYSSLVLLLFLGSQVVTARSYPMIHNISTDMIDPPLFTEIVALRGNNSNPHVYNAQEIGEIQKKAYPNIATLTVNDSRDDAFNKSLLIAQRLGWDIVSKDQQAGIIEASQTTKLWAFTDDVVIRISTNNRQTDIDLHSVSRVGRTDLGANAKRIENFYAAYSE